MHRCESISVELALLFNTVTPLSGLLFVLKDALELLLVVLPDVEVLGGFELLSLCLVVTYVTCLEVFASLYEVERIITLFGCTHKQFFAVALVLVFDFVHGVGHDCHFTQLLSVVYCQAVLLVDRKLSFLLPVYVCFQIYLLLLFRLSKPRRGLCLHFIEFVSHLRMIGVFPLESCIAPQDEVVDKVDVLVLERHCQFQVKVFVILLNKIAMMQGRLWPLTHLSLSQFGPQIIMIDLSVLLFVDGPTQLMCCRVVGNRVEVCVLVPMLHALTIL